MKKVLIVASNLCTGGTEKVISDIARCADPEKYHIDYLIFSRDPGDYDAELLSKGCSISYIPQPAEGYLRYVRRLTCILREGKYDAVHAQPMFSSGWAMLAGRIAGTPVRVAHSHGAMPEAQGFIRRLYERFMRRMLLRNATVLAACGVAAGNRLFGEENFSTRGTLVPNGIDISAHAFDPALREETRARLGLSDCFVICHAGHLDNVKNQAFLIDLMPDLLLRRPDARLILLGEGRDRDALAAMAAASPCADRISFPGNVEDVAPFLSAADVFALPSIYEGAPLALLEAQANGLPCVISDGVPSDACLTDLVTSLPLSEREAWADSICGAARAEPEKYADIMKSAGAEVTETVRAFYRLYDGYDGK